MPKRIPKKSSLFSSPVIFKVLRGEMNTEDMIEEDPKYLIRYLGECWHEFGLGDSFCDNCGRPRPQHNRTFTTQDDFDWLVKKLKTKEIWLRKYIDPLVFAKKVVEFLRSLNF